MTSSIRRPAPTWATKNCAPVTGRGALEADSVITYCGGGIAASSVAVVLASLGHERVAIYDGSLSEWAADPTLPMERD